MRAKASAAALLAATLLGAACSSGARTAEDWARARVTIDERVFEVDAISIELVFGEDGYFMVSGDAAGRGFQDCLPGLIGGMNLYGALPAAARGPDQLVGERLAVEFSGDGDDANLCFAGIEGLLGARRAWLTVDSVDGERVDFHLTGSFDLYDGRGDVATSALEVAGRGTAQLISPYAW